MNAFIETRLHQSLAVTFNPHTIARVQRAWDGNALVAVVGDSGAHGPPLLRLDCSYENFKQAWLDALNYTERFGDNGNGVVST